MWQQNPWFRTVLECGVSRNYTQEWPKEQFFFYSYIVNSVEHLDDGSYCSWFPWKDSHPSLLTNFSTCAYRTRALACKLTLNPTLLTSTITFCQTRSIVGLLRKYQIHKMSLHSSPMLSWKTDLLLLYIPVRSIRLQLSSSKELTWLLAYLPASTQWSVFFIHTYFKIQESAQASKR